MNVHVAEQQELDVPFAAPWSHDSPGSTKPSPHTPALKLAMAAAQLRDGFSVPVAEYVPVMLTIRYSGSMVQRLAGASAMRWPMFTPALVAVAVFVPLSPAA